MSSLLVVENTLIRVRNTKKTLVCQILLVNLDFNAQIKGFKEPYFVIKKLIKQKSNNKKILKKCVWYKTQIKKKLHIQNRKYIAGIMMETFLFHRKKRHFSHLKFKCKFVHIFFMVLFYFEIVKIFSYRENVLQLLPLLQIRTFFPPTTPLLPLPQKDPNV